MSKFLDKISSYNLFNYLFPGVVFCLIADRYFSYNLIQENIVVGVFLYYFVGLVISRIGSLVVEPFLKKINFVVFAEYSDFITASKNDEKLELLSEVNNMYRTIISLFFTLGLIACYEGVSGYYEFSSIYLKYFAIFSLFVMFLFSYRKQTNYIYKRILSNRK